MSKRRLRVAIIAPPWLHIPSKGYGGVEAVIDNLVNGLVELDVDVEVFGVGRGKLHGAKVRDVTSEEQFEYILKPMYDFSLPAPTAHLSKALRLIQEDGTFDVIHDHNYFVGPMVLRWATRFNYIPPAIHTIHGPPLSDERSLREGFPDNRPFWQEMGGEHDCYYVPISDAIKKSLPRRIAPNVLDTVHNAVNLKHFPFVDRKGKKNYMITLARFSEEKGQHIAAEVCHKLGYPLKMAGTVATITSNRRVMLEFANPLSKYHKDRDFHYYVEKVLPHILKSPKISFVGNLSEQKKMKLISEARALLFPITWNEPFGLAVIEALACGTPVVAMNRGAMPEIIQHGVNGFLANSKEEFMAYTKRIDEIDPENCRKSVEDNFSSHSMAADYLERYKEAIANRKERYKR